MLKQAARSRGWPRSRSRARLEGRLVVVALAAGLVSARAEARCFGVDLFPPLRLSADNGGSDIQLRAEALPFRFGRLYRIRREGFPPSFVLGTVHLADPRVSTLSKAAADALAASRVVAVETLDSVGGSDASGRKEGLGRALLARPEQRPDRLLDPAAFSAIATLAARRGLTPATVRLLKPAVLALFLDLPACAAATDEGATYLDAEVVAAARAQGLKVVGLETIEEQISIVDGLGPEVEAALLKAVIAQARRASDIVETTVRRYDAGDAGGLLAWMRSPMMVPGQPEASTPNDFLDRLLVSRNRRIHERIGPLLERGGAFVAVGLAHLPGPDGLLARLQAENLRIEAIE